MPEKDLRQNKPQASETSSMSNIAVARLALSLIQNPLKALPPEIFTEPAVFNRIAGRIRVHLADPFLSTKPG